MTQSFADFLLQEQIDLGPVPAALETACKAAGASYPTTLKALEKEEISRPQILAVSTFLTEVASTALNNAKNGLETDSDAAQLAALEKHHTLITDAFFQGDPVRFDFIVRQVCTTEDLSGIAQQAEDLSRAVNLTMNALVESKIALAKALTQEVPNPEVLDKALDAYITRGFGAALSPEKGQQPPSPQR